LEPKSLSIGARPTLPIRLVVLGAIALAGLQFGVTFSRGASTYSDFMQDYSAGREWRQGGDPYQSSSILIARHIGVGVPDRRYAVTNHPPIWILISSAFSGLSFAGARRALMVLSLLSLTCGLWLYCRARGRPLWLVPAVLALPVVQIEFASGQPLSLMLLLAVLGWLALERGRDWLGGSLLGSLVAIKIFPIILLLPLLRARRWRASIMLCVSAAVLTLTGAAVVGATRFREWLTVAAPSMRRIWAFGSYSPASMIARALHNPGSVIPVVMFIVFAVLAYWRSRTVWQAAPWAILSSPIAWTHYIVMALPSVFEEMTMLGGLAFLVALSAATFSKSNAGTLLLVLFAVQAGGPGSNAREALRLDRSKHVPTRVIDLREQQIDHAESRLQEERVP